MAYDLRRRQELEGRVKALRRVLCFLEQQLSRMDEQAQHKVIDQLDSYLTGDGIRREGFAELSEEAWIEIRDLFKQVSSRCKNFLNRDP